MVEIEVDMRRSVCVVSLLAVLASCALTGVAAIAGSLGPEPAVPFGSAAPAGRNDTLRVVTYNVGAFCKPGHSTLQEVVAMMQEVGADAVCLNELDRRVPRSGGVYQLKRFASGMGLWDFEFAPAISFMGGRYGVGLAWSRRLRGRNAQHITLPRGDGSEQRALGVVELERFVLATTHLDYKTLSARLGQVRAIDDFFASRYASCDRPVILCGDFNCVPDDPAMDLLRESWIVLSPSDFTFPSDKPYECIDYIMVWKGNLPEGGLEAFGLSVAGCRVLTSLSSGDLTTASDHLPVMLEIVVDK